MTNLKLTSKKSIKILFPLILLWFGNTVWAQTPTVQDCLGAIPICAQIYTETTSPSGSGNYPNEINGTSQGGICCMDNELNSIWYTFTVNQSGDFGFNLTPNNSIDDYDWAMFNITNGTCADIFNDITMQVSCNAAGGGTCNGDTGANGGTSFDNQGAGCNSNPPSQFAGNSAENALVPVIQGNTYVLVISNWSGSTNGYSIDFGVSSNIGIIDMIDPEIADITLPGDCGGDEMVVTFSEYIQCSTINGSNFQITGPGGPYATTVMANSCSQGGAYDNIFTISVNPQITEIGDYTIELVTNGTTEVLDLCENPSLVNSFDFTVLNSPLPEINIGNDTILCNGESVIIDISLPNAESYSWSDGTGGPIISITNPGSYTVTITNVCNTVTDDIFVNFVPLQAIDVNLGPDTLLCPGEIYPLDGTWIGGIQYEWQDGSTDPIYPVSESGFYEIQILGACGEIGIASAQIDYDETELFLNLGADSLLCEEDGFHTIDVFDPNAEEYNWSDGSTNPTLQITENGIYGVTISDKCNVLIDEVNLEFTNCTICEVYVPNAFSPDFNGYNDYFLPYSNCSLLNYSMKIFNRWGALIYTSTNPDEGWDGRFNNKDIPEGVYIYLLEFDVNQRGENIPKKLSGDVTVVK
ncbi:MAG: gliding motility-associated C-terminal domain-containing protein [Saprospiraceae bacterium]